MREYKLVLLALLDDGTAIRLDEYVRGIMASEMAVEAISSAIMTKFPKLHVDANQEDDGVIWIVVEDGAANVT